MNINHLWRSSARATADDVAHYSFIPRFA